MSSVLNISCKQATYLMGKAEEGKLSLVEQLQLWIHTSMCSLCALFRRQTRTIRQISPHVRSLERLADAKKNEISRRIADAMQ